MLQHETRAAGRRPDVVGFERPPEHRWHSRPFGAECASSELVVAFPWLVYHA